VRRKKNKRGKNVPPTRRFKVSERLFENFPVDAALLPTFFVASDE
jgi:hypothetical protein